VTTPHPTDHPSDPLDRIVDAWLTLPEVAERLGVDVLRVRQLVREQQIVAVRHGERQVLQVPSKLLVDGEDGPEPLPALHGTVVVLADAGFRDAEILEWLFDVEPALAQPPIDALRAGQRAAVRRVAQTLG
jgi:excisionase family DNA binding protein